MKKLVGMIFSVLILSLAPPLWAADAKKEAVVTVDPKDKVELAKKADMFMKVVTYGQAEKDPMIMLSAVRILSDLPFDSIGMQDDKGKDGVKYTRDDLLKQAREFAAGDAEMLALITKVQDAPEKTAVRGHHERYGHGPSYYGGHHYYERPYHHPHRRYRCDWFMTRHGDWVCR